MKWWYENEEKKMEFDKTRCYSALNADELRAGDKVIVANNLADLKKEVEKGSVHEIEDILSDCVNERFGVCGMANYALAYLVERKKNCTNCGENCPRAGNININIKENIIHTCSKWLPITEKKCIDCKHYAIDYCCKNHHVTVNDNKACADFDDITVKIDRKVYEYYNTKTEPHYRPFRDTDELIKVFCEKTPKIYDKDDEKLFMPYIWVRNKSDGKVWLITEFDNRILDYLFTNCEFLDGSPCGVEE